MKILAVNNTVFKAQDKRKNVEQQAVTIKKSDNNLSGSLALSNYNKALVSFKGYHGDLNPAKRLFWILSGTNDIYENSYIKSHLFNGGDTGWKKWVNLLPEELLKFNPKDSIEAICTLNKKEHGLPEIPIHIPSPNYGDKWGRNANYIEINPRTIACVEGDKISEGALNAIKLLPAIPPSTNSYANCVILSQLYPTMHNDGKIGHASLYEINLHSGISKNLVSDKLTRDGQKINNQEIVKAFNDLAHYRGLKTGIRMPLSSGQMQVQGQPFNWYQHEKAFIDSCCDAVDLGFDSIYFDSAKHVGFYDMANYQGSGSLPNFQQMQYITQQIRSKTGRNDIALIGEKCNKDNRFKEMGLTAGTDVVYPDNYWSAWYDSVKQSHNREYAAGLDVSNDNDIGQIPLNMRFNRIANALNSFRHPADKLPSFMQLTDLFPLNPYTNTHQEMMIGKNYSSFGDVDSHYNNIFSSAPEARQYTNAVYNLFKDAMYK